MFDPPDLCSQGILVDALCAATNCANVTTDPVSTGTTSQIITTSTTTTTTTTGTSGTTSLTTTGGGPELFHCCAKCIEPITGGVINAKCVTVNDTALCPDITLSCTPELEIRVDRIGMGACVSNTTCPARAGPCNNTCIWSTVSHFNETMGGWCLTFTWSCDIDRFIIELPPRPCVQNLNDVTIAPANACQISRGFDVCNRGQIGDVFDSPLRVNCSGQQTTICVANTTLAGPFVDLPPAVISIGTIAEAPVCELCDHTLVTWECNITRGPGQSVNDNDSTDNGSTTVAIIVGLALGVPCVVACCLCFIYVSRRGRRNDPTFHQPVPGQNVYPVPAAAPPAAYYAHDFHHR